MELKQLEYFITVAKLGNITHAAEKHFVSQPNITISIKKLEDELGVTLFQREYKRVVLTEKGTLFYNRIQTILKNIHNAVEEIQDDYHKQSGTITIGIPPMISTYIFAPLLQHFRETYLQWELNVVVEGSIGIREKISNDEVDLGIIIIDDLPDNLESTYLFSSEHKLCVPEHHPLCDSEPISFKQLKEESLIMMKLDSVHRKNVLHHCESYGFMPHILLSSNQIQSNLNHVANGVGLSFMLDVPNLNRTDLRLLSMEPPLNVKIGLVWKKEKYIPFATKDLIKFIKNSYSTNNK